MKSLDSFIFENNQSSNLGKKILNIIGKDSSDIVAAIIKRNERWDENKFEWSREPMFLVADAASKADIERGEKVRLLSWVRKKFFKSALDFGEGIQGTLSDYNISNDVGDVPKSVLGIYFDRQFYPITSLDTYKTIRKIIEDKE